MALKFRRGTTAQKSGSLAFGEPFVNSDLNTLQIGGAVTDIELVSKETFNTYTASVDLATQTTRIDQLAAATASINAFTASQITKDSTLASVTSSLLIETANLETFSASAIIRLNNIESATSSINSLNTTQNSRLDQLSTFSGSNGNTSLNTYTSSATIRLNNLESTSASVLVETANLETFSASALTRLLNIESTTSSINSLNTTQTSRLDQLSTFSASNGNTSLNSYTASNDTTNTTQNTRLSRLEESTASLNSLTSSYARTNVANVFTATQTISGSLYITQDLVVGGSSSIQTISSSRLDIGDNIIQLNVNSPSLRFGGLAVYDSGSVGSSGSFLYDSVEDEFIFVHKGNGINVTSSHFILGPETYDNLGNETYLTNNKVPKVTGKEHLNDSNITDTGTLITLGSNTVVNGTLVASGTTLVSGSSQINYTQLSGISANIVSASADSTTVDFTITGGSITANLIGGVVSGSSQVVGILASLNTFTASNANTSLNSYTSSATIRLNNLETTSASVLSRVSQLETDSGSQNTRIATLETKATTLASVTSSLLIETANLETFSASALLRLSQLETDTGSQNTRITTLESKATTLASVTSSLLVETANLETFSSSALIRLSNIESTTSSLATTYEGRASGAKTLFSGSSQVTLSSTTGGGTASSVQFGSLGIGTAASGVTGEIRATADITAYYSSDIRLKENIQPIENALDKIRRISGNTYDWKEGFETIHSHKGNDIGVIAQEVEEVLPILVTTREHGYKAVQYEKIVALLIEGMKEQQLQIEQLRIDLDNCRNNKGL